MSLSAAIEAIGGLDEGVTLWQWAKSAISSPHSRWSGSQQQHLQGRVSQLESGLKGLRDTLPLMHDLINEAEWRSHDDIVASLLPYLRDAVSDAEDLLDEFTWYEKKVQLEGNASQSPSTEFFHAVIQYSFNKLNDVQSRLSDISSQLENMGLPGATQHFDKLVRPENTSLLNETKIFGRDDEMEHVMGLLKVPTNSKRKRATSPIKALTSSSASNHVSIESRISSLPVLVIAGIGGVGKTTLARHICSHQRVKSHFEKIIWICISDDFDVKRLTKEAIQSYTPMEAMTDNLSSLQHDLSKHVNNKNLLIILDDLRDDALKENGQCWKRFCAPFGSVKEGSMMLVTTRCSRVAEGVRTMEPVILEGLKDEIFWNFFKLCAFGSEDSNNDPELERIGRSILPKLEGSPLAAKTLGRMLRMVPQASHWNSVLESDLWKLKQKETESLPALWLSYMHLPFYLKRCFAFCAVYPKDYKFEKACLAEIWVAEGFVEPRGGVPIQDIGCQYFEDLVARSFFQEVNGRYVIHDLLHGMAQKVSEHDCFILRNKSDFDKVPQNVRHLYVLPSSDVDYSDLLRLCKYTKLRTLICKKSLGKKAGIVMGRWCSELLRMRVISCASTNELPDSIGNWKHLRYLEISRACSLNTIPSTVCWLYNLQILYAKKCKLESLPSDFGKLISLQKFESLGLKYYPGCVLDLDSVTEEGNNKLCLIKNLNQFRGHLGILYTDTHMISKDQAAGIELKNKKYLDELTLCMGAKIQDNLIEVLEILQPPISLKSLLLQDYGGVSLPSWFQPQNLSSLKSLTIFCCVGLESISLSWFQPKNVPCLTSLALFSCGGLKSISSPRITQSINLNEIPAVSFFMSLTDLVILGCKNLSSLEDFLHPDNVPSIKRITITQCKMLASIPTEVFEGFHSLEDLGIADCPNIRLQSLVSPSLKKLGLQHSSLFCNIDCCSLASFVFHCASVTSIQLETWSLPSLQELDIRCKSLISIGDTGRIIAFSSLNVLSISYCDKLSTLDDLLTQEYLPAIEKIHIEDCPVLLSLPVERFMSFPNLKDLVVYECPSLNWRRGLVLPSYLQHLSLLGCGDISPCVPSYLQNLTSLVTLRIGSQGITSIPGDIWCSNLSSLEELYIWDCPDLVSIGGAEAVANIKVVSICGCPKLEESDQIMVGRSSLGIRNN